MASSMAIPTRANTIPAARSDGIGSVFAAIPGLTVILCVILFLPFTYQMTAIPGMMFLLGIYCAGGYGGTHQMPTASPRVMA